MEQQTALARDAEAAEKSSNQLIERQEPLNLSRAAYSLLLSAALDGDKTAIAKVQAHRQRLESKRDVSLREQRPTSEVLSDEGTPRHIKMAMDMIDCANRSFEKKREYFAHIVFSDDAIHSQSHDLFLRGLGLSPYDFERTTDQSEVATVLDVETQRIIHARRTPITDCYGDLHSYNYVFTAETL